MKKIFLFLSVFFSLFADASTQEQPKVQAVIFDCDGVLVDTEYLKFLAWEKALLEKNIDFSLEEYMPLVGNSSALVLAGIEAQKNKKIPSNIIHRKEELYLLEQKKGVPAIEPMVEFVKFLSLHRKELRIRLGLASAGRKEEILTNLRCIGLENVFDVVISGADDLGHYLDPEGTNKPKPYVYLEAAQQLGILPESCLVFEDTQAGVKAASTAGMTVFAVPNRFTLSHDFTSARQVIDSHKQLFSILGLECK